MSGGDLQVFMTCALNKLSDLSMTNDVAIRAAVLRIPFKQSWQCMFQVNFWR